jgi:hypothetical protein
MNAQLFDGFRQGSKFMVCMPVLCRTGSECVDACGLYVSICTAAAAA